jgi:hypothetical protein
MIPRKCLFFLMLVDMFHHTLKCFPKIDISVIIYACSSPANPTENGFPVWNPSGGAPAG